MTEETRNRSIIGLVLACIVLAIAFAVLSVYAAGRGPTRDGGAHALSPAGTGFAGIVQLAQASGLPVGIVRDPGQARGAGLLVLTPGPTTDPDALAAMIAARRGQRVLIVLPKWQTLRKADKPGWIEKMGLLPPAAVTAPLARLTTLRIAPLPGGGVLRGDSSLPVGMKAPRPLQTIVGEALTPAMTAAPGEAMVIGWLPGKDVYVLADPDLIANHALADRDRAEAAVALLAALGGTQGLMFDVTLNGLGRTPNLLQLAFEPPFLAMTLCLMVAAALAGARALVVFGTPSTPPPPHAPGKRALVDTAADLMRLAGREPAMARRYAVVALHRAAMARGAPAGLDDDAMARWLASRGGGDHAALAAAAEAAHTREAALAAARSLHNWQIETINDR